MLARKRSLFLIVEYQDRPARPGGGFPVMLSVIPCYRRPRLLFRSLLFQEYGAAQNT